VRPVLMDIRSGAIKELHWKDAAKRTLEVPVKDSVMAVADAVFIDWRETPPTPGELIAERSGRQVKLRWKPSPGAHKYEVQRSDDFGTWRRAGKVTAPAAEFSEAAPGAPQSTYRIRATSTEGPSPWSNPAWPGQ
jgi:hypothetical protein